MTSPTAKSFVLDLLSTLRRGSMPVSALVEAGELFDIAENSVRVALTRLRSANQVQRDARGRYRLGEGARPVGSRVTSWREVGRRLRRWDAGWVGVLEGTRPSGGTRAELRRRSQALRFLGFRALKASLSVRPDNLRGGCRALQAELADLGLPAGDLVFELRALDSVTEGRARGLWSAESLRDAHRKLRAKLEKSAARLAGMPVERAMVESFLLGGRVIQQLVLDPLLPDAIVSGAERRELLESMRRYDRLGRNAWADFLARFDVPHRSAPADTRMGAGADRLAR